MRLELLKDAWIKLGIEFEQRLESAQTDEERAMYQYLVESVVPSEIEFIELDEEYPSDDYTFAGDD